jgi:sulfate permease, SulP family
MAAPKGMPRVARTARASTFGAPDYVDSLRGMAANLAASWSDVARSKSLLQDLMAGLTVAAVALPLNLALAVASGVPPSAGLVAGALGGAIAATLGGTPLQVTGPAAALNVMVLALATDFGVEGVAAACVLIGIVELALAFSLAGRFAKHVPEAVLAGFTTGVGLKLLDSQIPEVLGFDYKVVELAQMMHRPQWLHSVSWLAATCGLGVAFLVVSMQHHKRFPAAIIGIGLVTFVSVYLHWNIERVGEVPSRFPSPSLPLVPDERWLDLIVKTAPLALLAGVESLLSARAIDRMAEGTRRHDPNLELFGQGIANIAVGFFGGMPITGVIVRSGVNVQSGARTRVSSIVHAAMLASAVLFLSHTLQKVPLAALAGLLCVIGYRLVEVRTFIDLVRREKIEAAAFAVTMAGTVSGHLMTGLVGGFLLHALHSFVHRREDAENLHLERNKARGIRAVLGREQAGARRPLPYEAPPESQGFLRHIRERAQVARTAFIHRQATVIGRVVLGDYVHIAAGSSVRADEGSPFFIGTNTNIQDGVVIHALKEKKVIVAGEEWAVYVGTNVSLAHDALVHGPCYIGDDTFVGFKAVVHDSVVGANCYIGIGAVVVGVEIPDGRFVPHGRVVDSADAVDALPLVSHAHSEFNEDVVEVNRGLASAYRKNAHGHASTATLKNAEHGLSREGTPTRAANPPVWDAAWDNFLPKERF